MEQDEATDGDVEASIASADTIQRASGQLRTDSLAPAPRWRSRPPFDQCHSCLASREVCRTGPRRSRGWSYSSVTIAFDERHEVRLDVSQSGGQHCPTPRPVTQQGLRVLHQYAHDCDHLSARLIPTGTH
jgi:hypothetical protein